MTDEQRIKEWGINQNRQNRQKAKEQDALKVYDSMLNEIGITIR